VRCTWRCALQLLAPLTLFCCGISPLARGQHVVIFDDLPDLPLRSISAVPSLSELDRDLPGLVRHDLRPARFEWPSALRQALLYTAVMHGFRLATEPGTRDAVFNGPFLRDYGRSIGALRGWGDGDPFVTNYVAHPMEGAIFSFIQQQNDPRYAGLTFSANREYWIGKLRGLSFAAIMSTQWKLGPLSEASIGNVQVHEFGGFVDFVVTPTVGTMLAVGEDAADRYLITALENHTSNIPVIMLVRCFLNPSRSFANLMAFRTPWHRETRFGLFGANHQIRREVLEQSRGGGRKLFDSGGTPVRPRAPREYPLAAPLELEASYHYERFLNGGGDCIGGDGSGALRINDSWQLVAQFGGCKILGLTKYHSGDVETYAVGPRWTPRSSRMFSPFFQALFGGRHATYAVIDEAKHQQLINEWADGDGELPHYPYRSEWQAQQQANGPAIVIGGGADIIFHRALAWRVARLEYTHSWLGEAGPIRADNGLRFTSGLVLRIGTW
jgi:hypothetical protein